MTPTERLRYHVTGAIERGEATPIVGRPAPDLTAAAQAFRAWLAAPSHDIRNGPDHAWEAFDSIVKASFADPESADADAFRDAAIAEAARLARL